MGEQEGINEVKQWLTTIYDGVHMKEIDLGSVKGYKRLRMCEMVRKEIKLNMRTERCSDGLQRICNRRLIPTPWLNRVTSGTNNLYISQLEAETGSFFDSQYLLSTESLCPIHLWISGIQGPSLPS